MDYEMMNRMVLEGDGCYLTTRPGAPSPICCNRKGRESGRRLPSSAAVLLLQMGGEERWGF